MKLKNKTYLYIVIAIFVISLIPLYMISGYTHPSVDDYYYGVDTHQIYENTGSVSEVIKSSYNAMVDTYYDWQGNFSAIFLMRLQPGIFGEEYYAITPVILITSFVLCSLFFYYTMLRKWFNCDKLKSGFASFTVVFAALQFTHVPSDSFYWYNGAIYYTFFHSLMLLLFALLTYSIHSRHMWTVILNTVLAIPLAFVIGGSNYSTALFTAIILVLATVYYSYKKDLRAIAVGLVTAAMLTGLCISILAPGNSIRQEAVGGSNGILTALVYSFAYGAYSICNATTAPIIILWIALIPVFYKIAANSKYSFRYPIFVALFTYGLFCSQGTAVFYAQGLRIPYRMMNIIYFSYFILISFNLIYLLGYLNRKYNNSKAITMINDLTASRRRLFRFASITVVLFAASSICMCSINEDDNGDVVIEGLPMTASATWSLVSGEARTYDNEINARTDYLMSTTDTDVEFAPLTAKPYVIFHTDITTDPAYWKNAHLALYYHKASVKLSE